MKGWLATVQSPDTLAGRHCYSPGVAAAKCRFKHSSANVGFAATNLLWQLYKWEAVLQRQLHFDSCINRSQLCSDNFTFTAVQMGGRLQRQSCLAFWQWQLFAAAIGRHSCVTLVLRSQPCHLFWRHSRVTLVLTSQPGRSGFGWVVVSVCLIQGLERSQYHCLSFTRVREISVPLFVLYKGSRGLSTTVCLIQGFERSRYHCLSYTRVREVSVPLFVLYKG